jgi:hypothetical protein
MYPAVLMAHGAWRWIVLALGVVVIVLASRGLAGQLPWQRRTALAARLFGIAVDIQVLIGAALYLSLSPLTTEAATASASLQPGSDLGFIGLYHAVLMLGALVTVHVAAVLVRRASTDAARHRRALATMCIGVGQGIAAAFERV